MSIENFLYEITIFESLSRYRYPCFIAVSVPPPVLFHCFVSLLWHVLGKFMCLCTSVCTYVVRKKKHSEWVQRWWKADRLNKMLSTGCLGLSMIIENTLSTLSSTRQAGSPELDDRMYPSTKWPSKHFSAYSHGGSSVSWGQRSSLICINVLISRRSGGSLSFESLTKGSLTFGLCCLVLQKHSAWPRSS